jgi:hypothetical protein
MPTAEFPGISMWYDERGQGDPGVPRHPGGAGVDSRALPPTVDALSRSSTPTCQCSGPAWPTPDVDGSVSYELMAQDTIMFIEGGRRAGIVLAAEDRKPDMA